MEKTEADKLIRLARNVSEILSSPENLRRALDATIGLIRSVLDAEACSIMLLDENEGKLRIAASSHLERDLWPRIRMPLGQGFAGKVAQSGEPLVVAEAPSDLHRDEDRRHRYSSTSFMCVPMKVKGRVIGVINVTNRRSREPFSSRHRDIIVALGNLVGLAIENARLLTSAQEITKRLEDVLEGIGDGVIAVNAEGEILHHNELALHYLGLKGGGCVGRRFEDVIPADLGPVFRELFEQTLTKRTLLRQEIRWSSGNGSGEPITLTVSTAPLYRYAHGNLSGVVFVIHDVSLRHQLDELQRIDEAKNNFLAIISHELRTPLTSIKGAIHLLRERLSNRLAPEDHNLFRIVEHNASRLLEQIVNILDVANIESGTTSLVLRPVNLSNLARRCVNRVRDEAERKKIEIVENYAADLDSVMGDEEKLARALGHIVDNAVKFTPHGGRVVVSTARRNGEVFIAVRDTGAGIDPAVRDQIFSKFVQAEGPMTRQSGGCGIGLFVARAFAELHGGHIEMSNVEGGGCEFRIVLPVVDIPAPDERTNAGRAESQKASG